MWPIAPIHIPIVGILYTVARNTWGEISHKEPLKKENFEFIQEEFVKKTWCEVPVQST